MNDVTRILKDIQRGDSRAASELLPVMYTELRKLAAQRIASEGRDHTLQATALVHEAYVRLVGPDIDGEFQWESRGHFFAAAAEAMRRILVDYARARNSLKRGGAHSRLPLDTLNQPIGDVPLEVLDLDDALEEFAVEDAIKAKLVELRFFGGLTLDEAARILDISPATADRHWKYAKARLRQKLDEAADG